MRSLIFIGLLVVSGTAAPAQENLLEQGNFSGGTKGALPPPPWIVSKPKPNVGIILEDLPGAADNRLWAHLTDESGKDAIILTQSFSGITSGRLTFSLHVQKFGAAVWFLLGRNALAGREDMLFTFKVTTKGGFLAATPEGKVANTAGTKTFSFVPGQTYDLFCDFKPTADQTGLQIEIGQKDGQVIFRGLVDRVEPITAFSVRTHGEDAGSDFYVTDLSLHPNKN